MPRKKTKERAKPVSAAGYSYGEAETAIAGVLKVDPKGQTGWLRGRIQHLRRLGFTPPADGGPVAYTFEWMARWLIALRLERIGVNPAAAVRFFMDWDNEPPRHVSLRQVIEHACVPIEKARKAKLPFDSDDVWLTIRFDEFKPDAFPQIGRVQPYRKPHPRFDNAITFFHFSREDVADVVVIPLTEILRSLETELEKVKPQRIPKRNEVQQ